MLNEGLLRIAMAGVLALLLGGPDGSWASPGAGSAYLAAGLTAAYGALLATGRPGAVVGNGLFGLLLDSSLVTVLVASTGGESSPFFPLYLLAALGVSRVPGTLRGAAGAVATSGGYPLAVLLAADAGTRLSPEVWWRVGLIAIFCLVAAVAGAELRGARENGRALSVALDAERRYGEEIASLVSRFGPVLEALSLEGVLRWTAETARGSLGASYAHAVVLEGNHHRTAVEGDLTAYPTWWHPAIQRLVQRGCQTGKVLRDEGAVSGIEGFLTVPVISAGGERLGALVVGGGNFGAEDERALGVLAAGVAPALRSALDAPGGRDHVTGLPNRASLRRVLRRELSSRAALTVMAVKLDGLDGYDRAHGPAAGDALLERLGENLRGDRRRRVFRSGREGLVVLLGGDDERKAEGYARGLRRLIAKSTGGSAAPSVGFVAIGPGVGVDPDQSLAMAANALREAENRPERILGLPAGARIDAAKGPRIGVRTTQAVQALMEAIAARDPHLAEHSRAVSELARRIALRVGLPQEQVGAVVVGALLHDVGKIAIPDAILQKPGPLTAEEYGFVRQHPILGAKILGPIEELSAALPAVRHHHERFDGEGYPDGLRGAEIPLMARITLAADAFDSMSRGRGYRRGVSAEVALKEVARHSGTQFDPAVVAALVRVAEETGDRHSGFAG